MFVERCDNKIADLKKTSIIFDMPDITEKSVRPVD